MIKIVIFKIWESKNTVSNMKIYLHELKYNKDLYYVNSEYVIKHRLIEMHQYLNEIGDKSFIVNGYLYFDSSAYFNLNMHFQYDFIVI